MNIRLADFIRAEMEPILEDWEEFAETILKAEHFGKAGLRDHASGVLLTIAKDLDLNQSEAEQTAKSKGDGPGDENDSSADVHGGDRHDSGFTVMETLSELRALRASVASHWTKANPTVSGQQLKDLTRFHEAIDQAVTETLEEYSDLKEKETRLSGAILLASPDPIFVLDLKGRFTYANKATAELFTLQPDAIIGQSPSDLEFSFASDLQRNLEMVIADQSIHRGKFIHAFASGQGERFEYLLAPVLDEHQNTEATVCILRDVTEQAIAEEKVWHHAHHDQLTGLPNRRLFLDRLEQEVKHAKRSSRHLAVLFMDLDGFKEINDLFGHEAGDRLLTNVSERLTDCVREEDTVARLGGDEFTAIITGTNQRKDVDRLAKIIKGSIEAPFEVAQRSVQVSISIGISFYPHDAGSPVDLLEAAYRAMYKAKKAASHQIDC